MPIHEILTKAHQVSSNNLTEETKCPVQDSAHKEAVKYYKSDLLKSNLQTSADNVSMWLGLYKHASSYAPQYLDFCYDQLVFYTLRENARILKEQNKQKAVTELGPREFTFTYGPTHFENDEDAQLAMKVAIGRLTQYYKDEIIEFHAIGEFTNAGRSHVHGWYHLTGGRKITDKNFKRAWRIWNPKKKLGKGFEGGHHATIARVSDFAGYAEKHLDEAWLNVNITNDALCTGSSNETEDTQSLVSS